MVFVQDVAAGVAPSRHGLPQLLQEVDFLDPGVVDGVQRHAAEKLLSLLRIREPFHLLLQGTLRALIDVGAGLVNLRGNERPRPHVNAVADVVQNVAHEDLLVDVIAVLLLKQLQHLLLDPHIIGNIVRTLVHEAVARLIDNAPLILNAVVKLRDLVARRASLLLAHELCLQDGARNAPRVNRLAAVAVLLQPRGAVQLRNLILR